MLKAWSITTTVRSPERLRDFLVSLTTLEERPWDNINQKLYQRLLIKNRLYGFGSTQFYNGLTPTIVNLINDTDREIDENIIDDIIRLKNYTDFAMRGRQSINPLIKFGFVSIDGGVIKITELGRKLIISEKDAGDVFLKSFIKWQIPNPASNDYSDCNDYGVVPFVATLKLINEVNKLEVERNNNPVGISKREFSLFAPTLVKYEQIESYARKIVEFRDLQKGKSKEDRKKIRDDYRKEFAINFLGTNKQTEINKLLQNLQDYGDNAIRYFRLTKFIRIRGNGFYVDLEPIRHVEIEALFESEYYKPKPFYNKNEYLTYMANDTLPILPWQTKDKLSQIANELYEDIAILQTKLRLTVESKKNIPEMSESEITSYTRSLRNTRKDLQEKENHIKSQPVSSIEQYIQQLENIFNLENRALMLEYLAAMGLHAMNDAVEIKPNYPVGDDNEPTSTASGGMADIECFYDNFNMICEVTMLKGRDQWFNEGQPVMRHLRNFEDSHKNVYCIFIAPTIHTDSAETFHIANTIGYKGDRQKIAPLTIKQFIQLLKTLVQMRSTGKHFSHVKLRNLVGEIADSAIDIKNSDDWIENTQSIINSWSASCIK